MQGGVFLYVWEDVIGLFQGEALNAESCGSLRGRLELGSICMVMIEMRNIFGDCIPHRPSIRLLTSQSFLRAKDSENPNTNADSVQFLQTNTHGSRDNPP